jgi:GrpB-like predicted nucleotidyltransferase (UPF0157 family)
LSSSGASVVGYDARWPLLFEEERSRLAKALVGLSPEIEHVGSTSVPGLGGKPVVDILLGIRAPVLREVHLARLRRLGYGYVKPRRARHLFLYKGHPRICNLHVVPIGATLWRDHILFRDYLRSHPTDARWYADQKRRIVLEAGNDRQFYARRKRPIVAILMKRAQIWLRRPRARLSPKCPGGAAASHRVGPTAAPELSPEDVTMPSSTSVLGGVS